MGLSCTASWTQGDAWFWDLQGDEAAGKETQALKIGCLQ